MLPARFFLTGTDTGVGKTTAAAALCRAFRLDYWKPVQAGVDAEGTDTDVVARLAGARTWPEAWRLTHPKSPHRAAADDGVTLTLAGLGLPPAPRLLVEGAGGWCVPFGPALRTADLVRHLDLPVVIAARTGLGTLNHTTLTVRAIRADGCRPVALVLVGPPHPENEADLPGLVDLPVLGRVPWLTPLREAPPLLDESGRPRALP